MTASAKEPMTPPMRRWLTWMCTIVACGGPGAAQPPPNGAPPPPAAAARPEGPGPGQVGQPAHRFFLRTVNPEASGLERLDLNQVLAPEAADPRVVVLSFAAFDCAPCKGELSALQERLEELRASGALFAVVVTDRTAEARARMVGFLTDELGVPHPVVEDGSQILMRLYGVTSLPHTVVVRPDGTIAHVAQGYAGPESLDRMFSVIAEANVSASP